MRLSKYCIPFKNEEQQCLIFNSVANSFIELDNDLFDELIKSNQTNNVESIFAEDEVKSLLENNIIVKNNTDDIDLLNKIKLKYLKNRTNNSVLGLTLTPTMDCNFNCAYCYEKNRPPIYMDEKTEQKIIEFVKSYNQIKTLSVCWYGGEPLLNFNTIKSLTEKFKSLNINYNSSIVTNGYLLDEDKINNFDFLEIKSIQITIDGTKEIHNSRRKHINMGNTFDKIVQNIIFLLQKNTKILVNIRVNIDRTNENSFFELYHYLNQTLNNKQVRINPALVEDKQSCNRKEYCLSKKEWSKFMLNNLINYKIEVTNPYPELRDNICMANAFNAFLIDAEGKIYKCWEDIGDKTRIIGDLHNKDFFNDTILNRYMVGCNPFEDEKCSACIYLPICGGGCTNERYKNKYENKDFDYCFSLKHHLKEFLNYHYQLFIKKNEKATN